MTARGAAVAVTVLALLPGAPALAGHCGDDDCGPHGRCREQSLIARCDCDDGYISVTTYRGGGSQGAWCTVMPAPPDEPACEGLACDPHGVCVLEGGGEGARAAAAWCVCDPGYRVAAGGEAADGDGACEDDPSDDLTDACADVVCGDGGRTCMPTPDAVTCRCTGGEYVVIGLDATGSLGPVCQAPANPETACGPEACGPFGRCVISQAAFCRCDEGATVEEREGPDGKKHPICVDPDRPLPDPDAGDTDAGDPGDTGVAETDADDPDGGAAPPDTGGRGGQDPGWCSSMPGATAGGAASHGATALRWLRRR